MKKYFMCFSYGSKIRQIVCAILINVPVFSYGCAVGWMSPTTLLLQGPDSPAGAPLTDILISWMASSAYLTCVPATFLFASLADRFGRKPALLTMTVTQLISWCLLLCVTSEWSLVTSRAVVGVAMAAAFVVCPLYTKEVSHDSIRGALGSLVVLSQTSGNLVMYVIGDMVSYRSVLWMNLALPAAHLLVFTLMPESPSYLLKHGRKQEATETLCWLRCRDEDDPGLREELHSLTREQLQDSSTERGALKNILGDGGLRRALQVALVVTLAREVCGANPVLNFAGHIFTAASTNSGVVLTPNQQAMMLGAVQVAGAILASSLVEKSGRKPLLLVTSLASGVGMMCLGTWFLLLTIPDAGVTGVTGVTGALSQWARGAGWVPLGALCLCIFCDAAGLQPISVVLVNEIFSYKYRGVVSAVTMSLASLADFLQLLLFRPVSRWAGPHWCFYFFGLVCLFHGLYVVLYVPETKGRTVEEIQHLMNTRNTRTHQTQHNHGDTVQSN